jgi:hypothetical protein
MGLDPHEPTIDCPVIQSYVDVIVGGAVHALGEAFAYDFISLTSFWPGMYISFGNDASSTEATSHHCPRLLQFSSFRFD